MVTTEPADDPASAMPAGALAEATPADDPASADMPLPAGAEALRSFAERGFAVCPGVFQPEEMRSFGARISELAVQEVADIVASGVQEHLKLKRSFRYRRHNVSDARLLRKLGFPGERSRGLPS